jgi:hypothetical protein
MRASRWLTAGKARTPVTACSCSPHPRTGVSIFERRAQPEADGLTRERPLVRTQPRPSHNSPLRLGFCLASRPVAIARSAPWKRIWKRYSSASGRSPSSHLVRDLLQVGDGDGDAHVARTDLQPVGDLGPGEPRPHQNGNPQKRRRPWPAPACAAGRTARAATVPLAPSGSDCHPHPAASEPPWGWSPSVPYKDPEKRRAASRASQRRRRSHCPAPPGAWPWSRWRGRRGWRG